MNATLNKSTRLVQLLLKLGASTDKASSHGMTVYHFATLTNNVRLLDYLIGLERHETVDIQSRNGTTPANLASNYNHFDCLNLLIEKGADLQSTNRQGNSCFEYMVLNDHKELLEATWEDGVQVLKRQIKQVRRTP